MIELITKIFTGFILLFLFMLMATIIINCTDGQNETNSNILPMLIIHKIMN